MKTITRDTHTQTKKLMCDWSDKKKHLIPYRMVKNFVEDGMVIDKVHTVISFKQSKWLEKKILKLRNEMRLQKILKKISINY